MKGGIIEYIENKSTVLYFNSIHICVPNFDTSYKLFWHQSNGCKYSFDEFYKTNALHKTSTVNHSNPEMKMESFDSKWSTAEF